MLGGVPLGQLGIEGINNSDVLPLMVLAAVAFIPELPPADTSPVGHRPRAHSLDSAPMLPKGVVIGCGGGSSIRALDGIFDFTGVTDHETHPGGQTSWRKDNEAQQKQLPPLPTPSSPPKPTS